ncbi:MAG TPA: glycine cleavage T C-terminal barrel domain-containing protein [Vicinamibacterales bacterium]|nr:glycine cleavage T C-terminal barrel domain-containing protein [Vicinamibacterales bacterium]
MIPAVSLTAYEAARRRAAFVDRSDRGRIVVSGTERAPYLQGLLTNDMSLPPGRGCYAAYLTAQGRMIADLYVYELGDVMLVMMDGGVKDAVMTKLDQFIFSEDVQLGDVTGTFAQVAVIGPGAADAVAAVLTGLSAAVLTALPEHGNLRVEWSGGAAIVTRITDTGEPGFDLYIERSQVGLLRSKLAAAEVPEMDDRSAETLRIETGIPRFHRDMDEETIPLEAGIESRAISFTKGCYVGQEVIIRVLHRGHGRVVRKLVGVVVDSNEAPAPGARIVASGREIGGITSSTISPALQRPIALGYVHRDFIAPGTRVTIEGVPAEVTTLPFVSTASPQPPAPTAS